MTKKWAIVTGATAGIGLSISRQLAQKHGYNLVLVARSEQSLKSVQSELQRSEIEVRVLPLDLSQDSAPEQLLQFTDSQGIVPEVLVNNAGIGCHGRFLETKLAEQIKMLRLNVEALVQLSYLYGQRMVEKKHGYIMQVASTAAFQPLPFYGLYAGTKSLVVSFSKTLNFEYGAQGVSSTAVCPGPTATNFFANKPSETTENLKKLFMSADEVARLGIAAMFSRREVCITGSINKIGTIAGRLAPSRLMMKSLADVMR